MSKFAQYFEEVLEYKRAFKEVEAASYIGMSRSFLRQSRMNGDRAAIPAPNLNSLYSASCGLF